MSDYAGALTVGIGGPSVGQSVSSPWFDGSWPITQGWGPSSFTGEPEGHGYQHWHAGVDCGLDCGTIVKMPDGLQGYARWVDNPGGYGTALRVELDVVVVQPAGKGAYQTTKRTFDVWLGHLRQRTIPDGTRLRGGEHLAISNNTGHSTGCHLHFEVRPAGGRYGTDVDPGVLLINPSTDTSQSPSPNDGNPYNPLDPRYSLWELEHQLSAGITSAETTLLGVGQAALGSTLLLGGLVIVAFGLRGQSFGQLSSSAQRTVGNVRRGVARTEFSRERRTQGAIAGDVAGQAAEQKQAAVDAAGARRNTLQAYRAGLISRRVAQERLGERIAPTGKRPSRVAFGRGVSGPGVYRKGRGTIDVRESAGAAARRSRVRVSHQRDYIPPPARPAAPEAPIPF